MLCMYSGWNIDGYFDLRVTFSIYPQWCDKRRFPLKAERKVKPTEPLWAVKCEHVRVWARRRTSVCVSQSIRLTDALDPLGLRRGAEARQLTWVVRGRFFQRDADVQDPRLGFRLKCSEVQNESTAHVLAASHGRCQILTEACVFVTRAVWACVVFGADCAGGGYRMLLVGLGLLADACRASNTILTLCLCSSVGGGCMAPLRTLVDGKK